MYIYITITHKMTMNITTNTSRKEYHPAHGGVVPGERRATSLVLSLEGRQHI